MIMKIKTLTHPKNKICDHKVSINIEFDGAAVREERMQDNSHQISCEVGTWMQTYKKLLQK